MAGRGRIGTLGKMRGTVPCGRTRRFSRLQVYIVSAGAPRITKTPACPDIVCDNVCVCPACKDGSTCGCDMLPACASMTAGVGAHVIFAGAFFLICPPLARISNFHGLLSWLLRLARRQGSSGRGVSGSAGSPSCCLALLSFCSVVSGLMFAHRVEIKAYIR